MPLFVVGLVARARGACEGDRVRIQRHLQAVEVELRARDVGHLPPALRAERRRNLDRLHAYWTAGEFPHNDDFPGERVPYFIDDDGVVWAVGFLVVDTGFADVAAEIRDTENTARLLAMTHPALPAWIAASGLSAEECARIQPEYCGCGDEFEPVCGVDGVSYVNECYATCAGVDVEHAGVCEGEDTTTGWPAPGTGGSESGGGQSNSSESNNSESGDATGTGAESTGGARGTSTTGSASTSTGDTSTSTGDAGAGDASDGTSAGDASSSDTSTGDDPSKSRTGCGCRTTGDGPAAALLGLLARLTRRRGRR